MFTCLKNVSVSVYYRHKQKWFDFTMFLFCLCVASSSAHLGIVPQSDSVLWIRVAGKWLCARNPITPVTDSVLWLRVSWLTVLWLWVSWLTQCFDSGDGLIGIEEYRVDCCSRAAYADIKELDDAYVKLCSVSTSRSGFYREIEV